MSMWKPSSDLARSGLWPCSQAPVQPFLHLEQEVSLEDLYMSMVPGLCTVCGKNLGMNLGSVFTISAQLLFLPPLLHPAQLIPKELQEKWQKDVDALHAKLGGTPERPIEIVIISLDTPDYLTVICAAGVRQLMLGSVGDVGMAQAMFSCHCWQPRCQQMLPTFVDQFQQFFIDKLCQLCQLLPDVEIPWKRKIAISGKA